LAISQLEKNKYKVTHPLNPWTDDLKAWLNLLIKTGVGIRPAVYKKN
jgi:hypothetical protein